MANVRFCDNDYSDNATITVTGSVSGFSYTNASNDIRSKVWKPAGSFVVTSSNNLVYINDGSDKTVTLTAGTYTYSTLATHVQTQLNASSSGWTVSYDYSGGTYKFTVSSSSTATLRFSQTTTAAWDMLGYTSSSDTSGTSWIAEEQRNHTMERYVWDLGLAAMPTFFAAIGLISEPFTVSASATIRLHANNINDWSSPPLSVTLSRRDTGILKFLDDDVTTDYRYWCFEVIDRLNPLGPTGLKFGRIWLGDYVTFTTTNVATGFTSSIEDPSDRVESVNGVRFTNIRPKYRLFRGLEIQNMSASERLEIEAVFDRLGTGQPFFFSVDPELDISTTLDELTYYAYFDEPPSLRHLIRDIYTMSLSIREAC